jgi:hypothetical protein
MKLLVPIVPKDPSASLRVIAVVRTTAHNASRPVRRLNLVDNLADALSFDCEGAAALVRSYLDVVYDGPVSIVMICNTGAPAGGESGLERAMDVIAAGTVDLVITSDLTRFSRHPVEVKEFLQVCAEHSTRVISFEDRVDTGDDD